MEKPTYNAGDNVEIVAPNTKDSNGSCTTNIILNHDFSEGLHFWHPNCCDGLVVSVEAAYPEGISENSRGSYAVVTNRMQFWQGLEQDITDRVLPGSTYTVSACVGVSGPLHGSVDVLATLKLEYRAQGTGFWFFMNTTRTSFLSIGRTSVSKERWGKLEGTFSLQLMLDRVVFYLEGPSPGIDLLIKSALITCSNPSEHESVSHGCFTAGDENIILYPIFEDGLNKWSGRGCKIVLPDSLGDGKIVPLSGKYFVAATERTQSWNGVQQEITGRVQPKLAYDVTAVVRIFGDNVTNSDVRVTLWVQTPDL